MAIPDCLFCKIVSGAIPAAKIFEDQGAIAFADINPQAPTHILVVPKRHIASLDLVHPEDTMLLGQLLASVRDIAAEQGLSNGYRTVINTGQDGGQSVDHLHIHLLGGRHMQWPPG